MREFLATPFFAVATVMLWCCSLIMDEDYVLVAYDTEDDDDFDE